MQVSAYRSCRLGVAIGHPDLIAVMNKVKAPYNVNQLTSDMAIGMYGDAERLYP